MIGKTILHYKILEKLGEGGMGVVYKARDTKLNREVAIKFLLHHIAPGEEERERFKIEAQAAAALNHPNIATIHAVEEVDGEAFIVMEYIKGRELKDIIVSNLPKVLHLREVIEYATQIAEGLQAAHEEGVIHRDIKSANIMITEKDHVKIMDFGLAKVRGGEQLTKEHSTLGTASYMSPEQALGRDIDHCTDIWSFGVVLYEMLTGQLPFRGEYDSAKIHSILNIEPESIIDERVDVPVEIKKITIKCLQKDKGNRYQTFDDLLNDLKNITITIDTGKSKPKTKPILKKNDKTKKVIGIIAAVIVVAIFVIIIASIFQEKLKNPKIVNIRPLFTSTALMEISPEFSPDGTRIAYVSDEGGNLDIWVLQMVSGRKRNLTENSDGIDINPIWSPDGEFLAFTSNRDGGGIFVVPEYGGNARKVVSLPYKDIRSIRWSPDGNNLAYNLKGKVYIIAANGGKSRELILPHSVRLGPTWSPESNRLLYVPWDQIWSVGLEDLSPTVIVDKPGDYLLAPIWSHDGERIYFKWKQGDVRDIWWVAVDEKGQPKGSVKPLSSGLNVGSFSISNDGQKLVYGTIDYQHNIYSLPIYKNRMLSLADAKPITSEKWYMGRGVVLAMSPDFEWISFITTRGGYNQIWIVQKNGKNLRQITSDSSAKWGGRWDLDGEHIAYSTKGDIYTISIKGGPATPMLADTADNSWPSWSPDGKRIAFMSNRSGNLDLWVIPVNGGEAEQLTTHEADDYAPLWSDDGDKISFGSDRTGAHEIYLYLIESGEIKKLTSVHSPDYIGYDWSPDGEKIYINYQPGQNEFSRNICEVNVQDSSMRTIFESKSSTFQNRLGVGITTDGEYVYFLKQYHAGETWIADLVYD